MTELRFFVPGKPQTAGSKSSVPITKGSGEESHVVGHRVVESGSRKSRAAKREWRADLRAAAERAAEPSLPERGGPLWAEQPLDVRFVFVRARPSGHLRTGKHAGELKDWAHELRPVARPDALKLARAAEDALTGILWADDSQIVGGRQDKAYGDQVGLGPKAEGVIVVASPSNGYRGPTVAARRRA